MTTIVLQRWHWVLFVVLWLVHSFGWWMTLQNAPNGVAVLHFLESLPAFMRFTTILSGTAGPAFLTTAILAKLLEVFKHN